VSPGEILEHQRAVCVDRRITRRRKQRDPVHLKSRLDAGRIEDRGSKVDVRGELVAYLSRGQPWATDDQRDPHGLLVDGMLPVPAVLAQHETVVRGEDDVGVVELADGSELVDETPNQVVDGEQALKATAVD